MKDYIGRIQDLPLFCGISPEELDAMMTCMGGYVRRYWKGEYISLEGEQLSCVGLVLDGLVHIVKEDNWGNRTILSFMRRGDLFGESFAWGSLPLAAAAFLAAKDSRVLFLPLRKVPYFCETPCRFHRRLLENVIRLMADKNARLLEKVEAVSQRTLRQKILIYLSNQARGLGCGCIEVPLGRTELAEYLGADRSALTRELSKMREEGILEFERNTFRLLKGGLAPGAPGRGESPD